MAAYHDEMPLLSPHDASDKHEPMPGRHNSHQHITQKPPTQSPFILLFTPPKRSRLYYIILHMTASRRESRSLLRHEYGEHGRPSQLGRRISTAIDVRAMRNKAWPSQARSYISDAIYATQLSPAIYRRRVATTTIDTIWPAPYKLIVSPPRCRFSESSSALGSFSITLNDYLLL